MSQTGDITFALWQLVLRTFHIMQRARQRELNHFGITLRASAVLSTIMRLGDKATISNIANQLVLEEHSVSAQLTRMEKDGLIEKSKDKGKSKLIQVIITEKGYDFFTQGMERKATDSIMSVLTEEEKISLWTILAKLRKQSMIELGRDDQDLYPPSNIGELPELNKQEGMMENILLNRSTFNKAIS